MKQVHWWCLAFGAAVILIVLHARLGYSNSASVSIDKSLLDASITSAAFA